MNNIAALKAKTDLQGIIEQDTELRGGPTEYYGPCPKHGGKDGFHYHIDKGWFCRTCTGDPSVDGWHDVIDYLMWRDNIPFTEAYNRLGGDTQMDEREKERLIAEREQRTRNAKAAEMRKKTEVRDNLTTNQGFLQYHKNLTPETRKLWFARGLTDEWIDYFKVGYCDKRKYKNGLLSFESASLTIPYLRFDDRVVNLVHRLLMDDAPGGRYRPHLAGAGKSMFCCDLLSNAVAPEVIFVEGEIKAMATWAMIWGDGMPDKPLRLYRAQVYGMPGKSWMPEWTKFFNHCKRIWIIPDPDAIDEMGVMAEKLGAERCKVVELPEKVDDLFTCGALNKYQLWELMEA